MASPSRKALAPAPQTPTARCPACRPLQGTEPDAGAPCPSAALSCPCAAPWGPSLHALREPSAPSWADHQSKVSGRPPGCLSRFPGAARPALPAGPQASSHPGQAAAAAASAASSGSSMVGGGAAGAVMWHSGLGPGRSALGLPPPTSGVGLQPGARTAGGGGRPTGAALPRTAPPPGPGAPPPFPVSHLRGWEPTSNPRAAPSPVPVRRAQLQRRPQLAESQVRPWAALPGRREECPPRFHSAARGSMGTLGPQKGRRLLRGLERHAPWSLAFICTLGRSPSRLAPSGALQGAWPQPFPVKCGFPRDNGQSRWWHKSPLLPASSPR